MRHRGPLEQMTAKQLKAQMGRLRAQIRHAQTPTYRAWLEDKLLKAQGLLTEAR